MRHSIFVVACMGLLSLGLSSFSIEKEKTNETSTVTASTPTLEQTCGNTSTKESIYINEWGTTLTVKSGEYSSFRIDWQTATGGDRVYYPKGTINVPVYGDRFTISIPGESSGSNTQTYCFVIHR